MNINLKAFLDMLAWSEGTSTVAGSDNGYNVIVGGGLFKGYVDHPRKLVDIPRLGIKSTAAGRYQLLSKYWDSYKKQLGLKDFSPASQDAVAVQQIKEQGALQLIADGKISQAISKCSNIWASLPGAGYGQHEHKIGDLLAKYKQFGGQIS
ncbi:Phage lysozyme [Phytobacter ursingii]|nr:Phage lysozyme [Phytobacter ursingii]